MSRRWEKPKPKGPQGDLPLAKPRDKFAPAGKSTTDTSAAAAASVGIRRGGDAMESVGDLAKSMIGVIERNSRKVKLAGVMIALTVRKEVLDYLGEHPEGATADEIADAIDRSQFTTRPRVSELRKIGAIKDSGARRDNATSGRAAIVWIKA